MVSILRWTFQANCHHYNLGGPSVALVTLIPPLFVLGVSTPPFE